MASQEPLSLLEFQARFKDEQAYRDHLCDIRWPHGYSCPKCWCRTAYYIRTRDGYECKDCSHDHRLSRWFD